MSEPNSTVSQEPTATPRTPRWALALVGFGVAPFLLLAGVELVLRLVGFGYSPQFFVREGEEVRENPKALWSYMPPEMARTPPPLRLGRQPKPGSVRLVVFGESAALGDPEPTYGFARYLEALLEARFEGTDFEVAQTAITAINSHVIRDLARDARLLGGDYWLFLVGNNEYVGPFGPATTFGRRKVSVSSIRLGVAARRFRLGQAVEMAMRSAAGRTARQSQWAGLSMFQDQRVHPDSRHREWVHDAFEKNLRSCLHRARQVGAEPIIAWTPVNLADCAPFADGEPEVAELDRFSEGLGALERGDAGGAVAIFDELTQRFSRSSEAWYWLGRARLAAGDPEGASFPLRHARELDALPLRTTAALNEVARALADEVGAQWVDPRNAMAGVTGESTLGHEALFEHAHFTPKGNYGLALAFAESVAASLVDRGVRATGGAWLDYQEASAALGMCDWEERFLWIQMRSRLREAPLNQRRNHAEALRFFEERIRSFDGARPQEAIRALTSALTQRPEDWALLRRRGLAYAAAEDYGAALEDLKAAVSQAPDSAVLHYQTGLLMRRIDAVDAAEARAAFERALALRPSFAEASLELAKLDADSGADADARARFEATLRLDPNLNSARAAWIAFALETEDWATALSQWQNGLTRAPSAPDLLRFFPQLLAQESVSAAARSALEAVAALPESGGPALKILCQARVRAGEISPVVDWLTQLLEIHPNYIDARYEFAVALIARGALPAAVGQLKAVTQARPDDGEAWFNLGVAYAKLGMNIEAVVAFESVPEGDANAANARQYAGELRRALSP